ncbi:MAG: hypothetical protein WC485_00975 [Opitutaceae bacterium]
MALILYDPEPGTEISTACCEAVRLAMATGFAVRLHFNDHYFEIDSHTDPDEVKNRYFREMTCVQEQNTFVSRLSQNELDQVAEMVIAKLKKSLDKLLCEPV